MGENVVKTEYQPYFCEENVWHLTAKRPGFVVFISNSAKSVALWQQRAAPSSDLPVVWDYHVVLVSDGKVFDLDTTLDYPCAQSDYFSQTFGNSQEMLPLASPPRFRLFPSETYRKQFSSDRGHMRRADNTWMAPPPAWPPIICPDEPCLSLSKLIDFSGTSPLETLNLNELIARLP